MAKDKSTQEELFAPYYQSRKSQRDPSSQIKHKEGSIPDILKISMSSVLFTFLLVCGFLGIFLLFFFMFNQNFVMGVLYTSLIGVGFNIFVGMKKKEKESQLVNQLPDTLSAVANSLKAGFSLDQAFEFVSTSMPEPTRSEFSKIHLSYRVGLTLAESLEDLVRKYPNPEVKLFVSSMVLQAQVGGNVIPFLEELKGILKERVKLRRSIAVGTAQTKLSSAIVALLPYIILMILVSSGWDALTKTVKGILLLVFAILMQVLGIYINNLITQVDVG